MGRAFKPWEGLFLLLVLTTQISLFGCGQLSDEMETTSSTETFQKSGILGAPCASGCIWSAYAVNIGAQWASHVCEGVDCACVVRGDAFSSCVPEDELVYEDAVDSIADDFGEQAPVGRNAGDSCGSGCYWSTTAVTLGFHSEEATCDGLPCACVQQRNESRLCATHSDATNTEPEPTINDEVEDELEQSEEAPTTQPAGTGAAQSHSTPYSQATGVQIARAAERIATARNTVGRCYAAAADAIETVTGRFLYGYSAYQAADQLAAHPLFVEGSVSDLRTLPAGVVVVWGKGTSPHGHISIALGDGWEASDHLAPQMTRHYGGAPARVFFPQ